MCSNLAYRWFRVPSILNTDGVPHEWHSVLEFHHLGLILIRRFTISLVFTPSCPLLALYLVLWRCAAAATVESLFMCTGSHSTPRYSCLTLVILHPKWLL